MAGGLPLVLLSSVSLTGIEGAGSQKAAAVCGRSSDSLYERLSSLLVQPLAFTAESKALGTPRKGLLIGEV